MPAIGKTYSMERESDEKTEEGQLDAPSASEPVETPEKPLSAGRGGVTQQPGDPLNRRYASGRRCCCVPTSRRHQAVRDMREGVQAVSQRDSFLFRPMPTEGVP